MVAALLHEKGNDLLPLADYWRGDWSLQRDIAEHGASMKGFARFWQLPDSSFLDYHEQVEMTLSSTGETFDASRRYRFDCLGDCVTIYFADGKNGGGIFQTLKPSPLATHSISLSGTHLCINDRYDTAYEIINNDSFLVIHRVEGPKKRYTSKTLYTRSPLTV